MSENKSIEIYIMNDDGSTDFGSCTRELPKTEINRYI